MALATGARTAVGRHAPSAVIAAGVAEGDGVLGRERFEDVEPNPMSGVHLSRALLPGRARARLGPHRLIGSESAVDVPGDMVHQGATKATALALADGLAKLTRGSGVPVNTVLGGPTWSDGVDRPLSGG